MYEMAMQQSDKCGPKTLRTMPEAGQSSPENVYMDVNATTKPAPEVVDAIYDSMLTSWGNPSSSHECGRRAFQTINKARHDVAEMIGAESADIVFTSGGTEANNIVIHSACDHFYKSFLNEAKPHVITSNIEHDSIRVALQELEKQGKLLATFVPVNTKTGCLETASVMASIRPTTCLVSCMLANNETGLLQPVGEIMKQVKTFNPKILCHTDAAQAIGKITVDVGNLNVDYLTIVGHKFYGPRIGALYAKNPGVDTPVTPLMFGGGQERGFRSGTENTPMIAGLGAACALVKQMVVKDEIKMAELRDALEAELIKVFGADDVILIGRHGGGQRLPNTCSVALRGEIYEGWKVLQHAPLLQASVGAACHSDKCHQGSPVLIASGIPESIAKNAMRLSIGRDTSLDDVMVVVKELKRSADELKLLSTIE